MLNHPAIAIIRQMQVPVLVLILLGACAAKLIRVLRAGSVAAVLDATVLFPPVLRRPATMFLCMLELGLGAGLALTAGEGGGRADAVRLGTALFFSVAMSALIELRGRRPDLGCGCFGDLSVRPVGARSIARAGVLAAAAVSSVGMPPFHLPPPGPNALSELGILLSELLLLASLSPEVGELLVRLGYSEPCELRASPPAQRILTSLHRSRAWRRHARSITSNGPADMWRELCWWYVVYPAVRSGEALDVVFAVAVKTRHPAVRAAMVRLSPPLPVGSASQEQVGAAAPLGSASL